MLAALLPVTFLLYLLWTLMSHLKWLKTMELPPMYPGWLPFIGHAHLLYGNTTLLWKLVQKVTFDSLRQGGVTCLFIGHRIYYTITDPEDCMTAANACLQKHYAYDFAKPWMGEGLVVSSGPIWKRHRILLNPAFSLNVLHGFLGVFNSQAKKLVNIISPNIDKGPFNHLIHLKNITLETVCMTAFGINAEEDSETERECNEVYMKAVDEALNLIAMRFQKIWLHNDFIYSFSELKKREDSIIKVLNAMSNDLIQKKRAALKNKSSKSDISEPKVTGIKCKPLMDLLMKLSEDDALSDQEIREEVDTAIVAAYDSSSCVLTYALMMIGTYPATQEKIFQELYDLFGDSDRDVEKDDLPKMVYTEAVIKETLRLLPTGPVSLRHVDKDVKLKNYTMYAGSECAILNWGVNVHSAWGPDAQLFRPERWLTADTSLTTPLCASFSFGKRSCIGQTFAMLSMKITLSHVLRQYRVSSDVTKLVLKLDFILKPESGHQISITKRT